MEPEAMNQSLQRIAALARSIQDGIDESSGAGLIDQQAQNISQADLEAIVDTL